MGDTHDGDSLYATDFRTDWPGWATVESEPVIFDVLLRKMGVQGMSVEEVYSLSVDVDALHATSPIHGLIFLFRWRSEPSNEELETTLNEGCPKDIWFANQVIDNACASLALLNIVFNTAGADIGDQLSAFKTFTADFTPAMRGLTLTNSTHLRRQHNTFAHRSEMAKCDLELMRTMRSKGKASEEDEDESAYHFVAFVHKHGYVWELDGLKSAPVRLDRCDAETWVSSAASQIQARMARSVADEIDFNLLAVRQDPTLTLQRQAQVKEAELMQHVAEEEDLNVIERLQRDVLLIKQDQADRQTILKDQEAYALRRQHDYTDFSLRMLTLLNDKGVLEQMLG